MFSRAADEGFEELYRRHFAAVLAYSTNRVGASDAPDVAQQVFIVALRRWERLPSEESARRAWLLATARREVANRLRSDRRRRARENAGRQRGEVADPADDVTVLDLVERLLVQAGSRSADDVELMLLLLEERSTTEIASVLGISRPAAATRAYRLRQYMKAMSDEGGHEANGSTRGER